MAERVVKLVRPRSKVASFPKEVREKRVAAYARVSTDSDEQMGSVEAQKDYFEKLIREKSGWTLVEVYADATDIIGLKQNPTNGCRFSPIFSFIEHFAIQIEEMLLQKQGGKLNMARTRRSLISASQ